MWARVEIMRFVPELVTESATRLHPEVAWRRRRAKAGEQVGHRLGIAGNSKEGCNSCPRNARKIILQIHAQNDPPPDMRSGERLDGPASPKTVRGGMCWNFVQNVEED